MLIGKLACWRNRPLEVISSLQDIEFKVTSQWGEDGIIDWLIERAQIPPHLESFVEFGVEDYREANTRFLLQNRNWRGLILDGGRDAINVSVADGLAWRYDLKAKQAFITRDNINELISSAGFTGEIGLLSIDLDGNDHWIWESVNAVNPIIVICEYNAVFGDLQPISIPYSPSFYRTHAHFSNLYFGSSIAALRLLGERKGYRFVGTTGAANDAFFVREDYAKRFVDCSLKDIGALPSSARESFDKDGNRTFIGGLDRLALIRDMPVVNTVTGAIMPIGELGPVYSGDWLARISRGNSSF